MSELRPHGSNDKRWRRVPYPSVAREAIPVSRFSNEKQSKQESKRAHLLQIVFKSSKKCTSHFKYLNYLQACAKSANIRPSKNKNYRFNRGEKMKFLLLKKTRIFFVIAVSIFLLPAVAKAEKSLTEQRQQAISKAQNDLVVIREKLGKKLDEQVKTGDKTGARNTQLRIQAAMNLDNMLRAESGTGGDIFKLHLIAGYSGILNVEDFSNLSFREISNYNMSLASEIYDGTHITDARVRIETEKPDLLALQALQDKAIYFASKDTYTQMHDAMQKSLGEVAIAINDTFVDLNPASSLLQAALGVGLSGDKLGQELSTGDRAYSFGKFFVEVAFDIGTDKLMSDTMKGLGTRVGSPRPTKDMPTPGSRGRLDVDVDAPRAKAPSSDETIIGHVDLQNASHVDDMTPFTGLDNFNIDLRSGQVTTRSHGGGRIGAVDQTKIEAGFNPKSQSPDNQATAVFSPVPGEQIIGHVDLDEVNNVFDIVGLTKLENFNIDLRTGTVTTSSKPGGRLSVKEQGKIEADINTPRNHPSNTAERADFHHAETELDIHNMTTQSNFHDQTTQVDIQDLMKVKEKKYRYNEKFSDSNVSVPGTNKPADEIKPFWDIIDLGDEDIENFVMGKEEEQPKNKQAESKVFPVLIYVANSDGTKMGILINFINEDFGWNVPEPLSDPFGDCLGPQCVPSFGAPGQPFGTPPVGPDLHTAPGAPGMQFVSNDQFLNDPVFFVQRFGELFEGASPSFDSQNQPN